MHKLNEKDIELASKKKEISIMNDTLDDLNRSAWNLYNLVNGNTYKGRMDDVKKDIVILLEI